ncbi:MAG: Multidrug resistance protein MdtA [Hyphomicrobiaceae bacterium hypho_1]
MKAEHNSKCQDHLLKNMPILNGIKNFIYTSYSKNFISLHARLIAKTLLPVFVLLGAIGFYKLLTTTKPKSTNQAPQKVVLPVRTMSVSHIDDQPVIILYGTTVAGRELELRALVAGKVMRTGPHLLSGGEVKTGDMLLEIESFDYEIKVSEIQSQLSEANAKLIETKASLEVDKGNLIHANEQLRLAQIDLNRAKLLFARGTVSKRTVDDRSLTFSQRQQVVRQYKDKLKVWSARKLQQQAVISRLEINLASARKRLAETRLKSPFNAYVTDVGAQVGLNLSVNDRVATLIDRDWIDVRFAITDRQFGRLSAGNVDLVGRGIVVSWDVGSSLLRYEAIIERIDARVKPQDGGIYVYGRIKAPLKPAPIRPGTFVEVKLFDIEYKNVVKVPSEALYEIKNSSVSKDLGDLEGLEANSIIDYRKVYVITEGKLRARQVRVVGVSGKYFLIRGKIRDGENVLVTRLSRPGEGVLVKDITKHGN